MEHRDVDHEPDAGSGQHAEKYSAHRVDFFVHLCPPRPEFQAVGPAAQWAIRKEQEKQLRNSVFARCQVVKLSQTPKGCWRPGLDAKGGFVRGTAASGMTGGWYRVRTCDPCRVKAVLYR